MPYLSNTNTRTNVYKGVILLLFMTLQSKRIHRVNYILSMIQAANARGQVWNEEVLISEICMKLGAARRYVKEILKDLENTKRIIRDLGEIFLPKQYDDIKLQAVSGNQIKQEADDFLNNQIALSEKHKEVETSGT